MEEIAEYKIKSPKTKKDKYIDALPVKTIRGESAFAKTFGFIDGHTQAKLRERGMPFWHDGSDFIYPVDEVYNWMRINFKPQTVKAL